MRRLLGLALARGAARRRSPAANEAGQAVVEFALTLILLMAFVLFFVQLSLVMAWGNYVHYATFMAARAFLAAGDSRDDQVLRASAYMERMVKKPGSPDRDRYPFIATGVAAQAGQAGLIPGLQLDDPVQFDRTDRAKSWMQGVRYTFRSRIFMMPLAGRANRSTARGQVNEVSLTSESWLGREPSYAECLGYMQRNFGALGKDVVIDNGC